MRKSCSFAQDFHIYFGFLALAYVTWQSLKNWQKNLMPVAIAYTPYMLHTST